MPPVEEIIEENAKLRGELSTKDERIAELEAQIAWFRRHMFAGGKSEKIDPKQLDLLLGKLEETKAEEEETEKIAYERKVRKKRRSQDELYGHLPVEGETVIEPEEVKANPEAYERFDQRESYEVRIVPPRFYRHRFVYPKYRKIGDKTAAPVIAPAPPRVVEGLASVQLLAYIVVSKYLDHLPLYRQCAIYKRYDLNVSRQNLVRWVEKVAEWLKPIYNHMRLELFEGDYLQADETPVKYCDPDYGERKARTGQLCGYSTPGGNVCYKWSVSRDHDSVTSHIKDFKGVLQSDAYQAYINLVEDNADLELAACWAHARRKFFEAKDQHPRECGVYLKLVAKLYAVEAEIRKRRESVKDFGDVEALAYRKKKASNTHARIRRLLMILRKNCLPQSRLGKACDYSIRIWDYLSTYLTHGNVQIDNNLMENAIRPTAIGKKNWLFVGHPEAGERAAIIYSILISCQRHGIDPSKYLRDVLTRDTRTMSEAEKSELTPAKWKLANKSEG